MKSIFIWISCFACLAVQAQTAEESISKGNEYYRQSDFELAEKQYRLALKKDPDNTTAKFNLANTLHKQKKDKEAADLLADISERSTDPKLRSSAYYNAGVIFTKQKDLKASIEAYKSALRLNPDDQQARENLQKALQEQKKQQQNQSQSQNNKSQSKLNQSEAQRQLDKLQEKEKRIQERMQRQKGGTPMPNDW